MLPDEPVLDSVAYTRWLTTADVVALVQVNRKIIYRAIRRKQLRAAQIDGRGDYRFKREWVDAWVESCAEPVEV